MKTYHDVKHVTPLILVLLSLSDCGLLGRGGNAANSSAFGGCPLHSSF